MSARFGRNKRRRARAAMGTPPQQPIKRVSLKMYKDCIVIVQKRIPLRRIKLAAEEIKAWNEKLDNIIFNWIRHGADAF